jgi:16S rRNA (adenine1518-N6/adenine1519-N6)-dimethyltransferase
VSKQLARSARKRFGQNFLVDGQIIDAIVSAIAARPGDHLVEIGPGHGAITAGLFASGAQLTLIELDRDLVPGLVASYVSQAPERCELISADVLQVDFRQLTGPFRVIGNLPYNISTPLLFQLLASAEHIIDMHVMLQQEVVNRIIADPGTSAYGRLSVMIQAQADAERLIDVPPAAFAPSPKVNSGVIRIQPKAVKRQQIDDLNTLETLVRRAFGQRRKTLRNNLHGWVSDQTLEALNINASDRPERLPVETYVTLANALAAMES